jgi:CPA2 family monovalent cation:H+ antiporter-2
MRGILLIGVTDAVPETIEASLLLSEAALIDLGVAMGLVVASIRQKREEFGANCSGPQAARPAR